MKKRKLHPLPQLKHPQIPRNHIMQSQAKEEKRAAPPKTPFELICEAAIEKNEAAIKELLKKVSIDVSNGIDTPASLLAAQGNIAAVNFLREKFNASPFFIAFGYARAGNQAEVNKLLTLSSPTEKSTLLKFIVSGYAAGKHVKEITNFFGAREKKIKFLSEQIKLLDLWIATLNEPENLGDERNFFAEQRKLSEERKKLLEEQSTLLQEAVTGYALGGHENEALEMLVIWRNHCDQAQDVELNYFQNEAKVVDLKVEQPAEKKQAPEIKSIDPKVFFPYQVFGSSSALLALTILLENYARNKNIAAVNALLNALKTGQIPISSENRRIALERTIDGYIRGKHFTEARRLLESNIPNLGEGNARSYSQMIDVLDLSQPLDQRNLTLDLLKVALRGHACDGQIEVVNQLLDFAARNHNSHLQELREIAVCSFAEQAHFDASKRILLLIPDAERFEVLHDLLFFFFRQGNAEKINDLLTFATPEDKSILLREMLDCLHGLTEEEALYSLTATHSFQRDIAAELKKADDENKNLGEKKALPDNKMQQHDLRSLLHKANHLGEMICTGFNYRKARAWTDPTLQGWFMHRDHFTKRIPDDAFLHVASFLHGTTDEETAAVANLFLECVRPNKFKLFQLPAPRAEEEKREEKKAAVVKSPSPSE